MKQDLCIWDGYDSQLLDREINDFLKKNPSCSIKEFKYNVTFNSSAEEEFAYRHWVALLIEDSEG